MEADRKVSGLAAGLLALIVVSGCSGSAHDDGSSTTPSSSRTPSPSMADDSDSPAVPTDSAKGAKSDRTKEQSAQEAALDDSDAGKPTRGGRQLDVFQSVPGNKSPACVDVGSNRDVRSGGFVGGAFDEARAQFDTEEPGRKRGQVRLYWIPMHAKALSEVSVKVTRLTSGETTTVHQKRVADADLWKFYDTMLEVDAPGRWRFEVSSRKDRGCFEVEFK